MTWELYQIVFLSSLIFSNLVKHSSPADLDVDFDSALGSSALVGEQAMTINREALEVWVGDDIPEATFDVRWSQVNAQE